MWYTLGKTILWPILALILGGIIGWLLHNLTCKGKSSTTVSSVESEELTRLRGRVANLEPIVAERDRLKLQLAEVEGDLKACMSAKAGLESAPAAFAGIPTADHDAVIGERDRLHGLVGAHEATIGDLRAQIAGLQANVSAAPSGVAQADHDVVVGERDRLHGLVGSHEATITDLRAQLAGLQADLAARPQGFAAVGLTAADLDNARQIFGKPIKMDDLKIVEGIGPVFERVFNDAGIETWVQLAETSPDRLKEILLAHDDRNRIQNTSTWPSQSRLAALGKFEELKKMQDELTAGKE